MKVKNKVLLITYPDSLGGDLKSLDKILKKYFLDVFAGGIHILPPFPSSGDRGFAPLTYLDIEPTFGNWEDIKSIGKNFDVMLDLMVNHISQKSHFFQDFLQEGQDSKYADLFIPIEKIWKSGKPKKQDMDKIFLRRVEPYSTFTIKKSGKKVVVWTTFGKSDPSEQIDLDVHAPATKKLFEKFLENFAKHGVKMVRLDAVGYTIKKPGTSFFFVEPEVFVFLKWIAEKADKCGITLLPEIHSHFSIQYKLAERGYWIYDFILPYLVMESLFDGDATKLYKYLKNRPQNQFTMLDCHDGVPTKPDLDELVQTSDMKKVVQTCLQRGANLSKIFAASHRDADGFDVHQIRCSYYSMLDCNDNAYIAARAIQFFVPGIPMVYYVGLLAGKNDEENIKATGDGREINRHNYTIDEFEAEITKPVVQRLLELIRFRNNHAAFSGKFKSVQTTKDKIVFVWEKGSSFCKLTVDLKTYQSEIQHTDKDGKVKRYLP